MYYMNHYYAMYDVSRCQVCKYSIMTEIGSTLCDTGHSQVPLSICLCTSGLESNRGERTGFGTEPIDSGALTEIVS